MPSVRQDKKIGAPRMLKKKLHFLASFSRKNLSHVPRNCIPGNHIWSKPKQEIMVMFSM